MSLFPEFERTYLGNTLPDGPVRWLPFRENSIVVQSQECVTALIADSIEARTAFGCCPHLLLGTLNGISYVTCTAPLEATLPDDWRAIDVRKLYELVPEEEWLLAGYASQILHWERTSRFCPLCGSPTKPMQKEWMRECESCGHTRFPQVSPAVLILVHDGADRILLAHKPGWGQRYSILAGFVLPGESLEECVQRETDEEAGLRVTDLEYVGSQPWPFPHQLMIGFNARYLAGDIEIDADELDHAAWFNASELPPLPSPMSLSRQMIDAWQRSRTL